MSIKNVKITNVELKLTIDCVKFVKQDIIGRKKDPAALRSAQIELLNELISELRMHLDEE